jgi:hypothetical protein
VVIEIDVDYEVTQAGHTGACQFMVRSTCCCDLVLCEVLGERGRRWAPTDVSPDGSNVLDAALKVAERETSRD